MKLDHDHVFLLYKRIHGLDFSVSWASLCHPARRMELCAKVSIGGYFLSIVHSETDWSLDFKSGAVFTA